MIKENIKERKSMAVPYTFNNSTANIVHSPKVILCYSIVHNDTEAQQVAYDLH